MPVVATSARMKPVSIVRALTRQGAGKSAMLAPMAPSVASWPPAKPRMAMATADTAATLAATLTPLTICCPTNNLSSWGDRSQWRMTRSTAPPRPVKSYTLASPPSFPDDIGTRTVAGAGAVLRVGSLCAWRQMALNSCLPAIGADHADDRSSRRRPCGAGSAAYRHQREVAPDFRSAERSDRQGERSSSGPIGGKCARDKSASAPPALVRA